MVNRKPVAYSAFLPYSFSAPILGSRVGLKHDTRNNLKRTAGGEREPYLANVKELWQIIKQCPDSGVTRKRELFLPLDVPFSTVVVASRRKRRIIV